MICARVTCDRVGTEIVDGLEYCSLHAAVVRNRHPLSDLFSPETIERAKRSPVFSIEVNAEGEPVALYDSVSGRRWKLEEEL